jgi:RHS repeat-associated protein
VNRVSNNNGVVEFGYDQASRLVLEKQAGKGIDYTYNTVSNLTDITYPNERKIKRDFDVLNRMRKISEGNFTIANMTHIGRSYRLIKKQYGNGDLIQYLYDHGRRLTEKVSKHINNGGDETLINHYKYGYNKIHFKNYEQRLHNTGKADMFSYDSLYRLKNVKFGVPDPTAEKFDNITQFDKDRSYNFDKLSNILSIVDTVEDQTKTITNTITEGSNYYKLNQYEKFDQWALEYDKNGNLTQKGTQQFTYDYRDQLVKVEDGSLEVEMRYDVMGRRIQKVVSRGSQSKTRNFYYSGSQLIEERDETDQVTRQYFYGNGIDEILRMDIFNGSTKAAYYFHTDSIGSVTAITDENGNLVERVIYDTYGMPTFLDPSGNQIPASTIGNTILFQGREYDSELNLYYYRFRYYDPIMGRFLQTDPRGYQDSMNLYQGFNLNPGNFNDPFGLSAVQPSVIGTSPGEMMLYHTDPEFRSYVDGCYSGFGQAFTNPMTYATIGLTIINPAVGIAFGLGALTNSYYHSVKDRLEEGHSIGKSLGGGLKDISGITNIEAGLEEEDPYKSGELVAEGSAQAAATIASVLYFGRYALQKIRGAVNVKGTGNTNNGRPQWLEDLEYGNNYNKAHAFDYPNRELYIENPNGGYYRLDGYNPGNAIVSRKFTQLGGIAEQTAINYINELSRKYPAGAKIADVPSSGPLSGSYLYGQLYLEVPFQNAPIPAAVNAAANAKNILIVDVFGNVYNY